MKELSIKEKAKHYDELIERAKNFIKNGDEREKTITESIFAGIMEESEDKKISKNIISWLKNIEGQTIPINDYNSAIAWLEKKGENADNQKILFSEQNHVEKTNILMSLDEAIEHCKEKSCGNNACALEHKQLEKWLTELKELKEQKSTDNVEHKFNVDDWVVSPNGVYWHIDKISNNRYEVTSNTGESSNWNLDTNIYHKFTIQDAKDGDVLATENFIFIFKNIDSDDGVHYYCHYEIIKHEDDNQFDVALPQSLMGIVNNSISHYFPASKEQRDLLFQKIKEAGYEWDANKKELKKIKQNDDWGEEDEINRDLLYNALNQVYDMEHNKNLSNWINKRILLCSKQHTWSEEDENKINSIKYLLHELDNYNFDNWFKSIKDRVQLQPKQEWNEEDESWFKEIELMCLKFSNDTDYREKFSTWLKFLKYRVQAQSKHEWSEEDEILMKSIAHDVWYEVQLGNVAEGIGDKKTNWLKFLKYRVQLQSQWKPSDEQISLLQAIVNEPNNAASESCQITLKEVIRQLKKLRNE